MMVGSLSACSSEDNGVAWNEKTVQGTVTTISKEYFPISMGYKGLDVLKLKTDSGTTIHFYHWSGKLIDNLERGQKVEVLYMEYRTKTKTDVVKYTDENGFTKREIQTEIFYSLQGIKILENK